MLSFTTPHFLIYASLFLSSLTSAVVFFPHSEARGVYSQSCLDAVSTNITQCRDAVSALDSNTIYTEEGLQAVCTDQCRSALQSWEAGVKSTCKDMTITNGYGNSVPVYSLASSINFQFNQTCLINDGEFCNLVLGNLTAAAVNGSAGNADCNKCSLWKLRDTAQFQYGDGPLVYFKGVYQSYTSSCHFTGYPLTAKPSRTPISSTAAPSSSRTGSGSSSATANPASTCQGDRYKIKAEDTCNSISLSQGVATWQLLMDNDLPSCCNKFPKSGSLCIKNKCDVYTVKNGDTCSSVASAHNISTVQLRAYNPWINTGCYNFNRTIDTQICVNEPGQKYVPPATPSSASTSASGGAASAAPVPSNIAPNTTTRCGEFYEVKPKEECDIFIVKFGISREDFEVLNPEIDANCTNLWANTSYCVQPVGDINSYPGAPGYVGPSSSVSKLAYNSLPDATYSPIFEILPLAPNTRKGCDIYVPGSDLQYNSTVSSACDIAGYYYNISIQKLVLWNPSLHIGSGSSNSTYTCSFSEHYRYCLDYPEPSSTAAPGGSTSTPLPSATKH